MTMEKVKIDYGKAAKEAASYVEKHPKDREIVTAGLKRLAKRTGNDKEVPF